MYGGKRPRRASVIAGAISVELLAVVAFLVGVARTRQAPPSSIIAELLVMLSVVGPMIGALVGYAIGGLVAGVFLLLDMYDAKYGKQPSAAGENVDPLADD